MIRPQTNREWGYLIAGAVLAIVVLTILGNRFDLVGTGPATAFRMDRWTGGTEFCVGVRACQPPSKAE